jgi:hypothetical protein
MGSKRSTALDHGLRGLVYCQAGDGDAIVVAHATMAWGMAMHMRLPNYFSQLPTAMATYV